MVVEYCLFSLPQCLLSDNILFFSHTTSLSLSSHDSDASQYYTTAVISHTNMVSQYGCLRSADSHPQKMVAMCLRYDAMAAVRSKDCMDQCDDIPGILTNHK